MSELQIKLTGLGGLELTDALVTVAKEKLNALSHFSDKIKSIELELEHRTTAKPEDAMKIKAHMSVQGKYRTHYDFTAKASDMYIALDQVVDQFTRKLRRRKRLINVKRKTTENH